MLANGITLGVKRKGETEYKILEELKEVPDLGTDPEKVDNTRLKDKVKRSELGVGDAGDLTYKLAYENSSAESDYRIVRDIANKKEIASWEETLPDGTKFRFDAQAAVKVGGGGVNGVIDTILTLGLQSDITVVDPEGLGE